jgi:hypothetical protein
MEADPGLHGPWRYPLALFRALCHFKKQMPHGDVFPCSDDPIKPGRLFSSNPLLRKHIGKSSFADISGRAWRLRGEAAAPLWAPWDFLLWYGLLNPSIQSCRPSGKLS